MDRRHKQADETHVQRDPRRSMTYNRGSGMARHPELARRLKIDIRIGRPARPPGNVDRTRIPTDCRKTLGWKTPAETMAAEIAAFGSIVALKS